MHRSFRRLLSLAEESITVADLVDRMELLMLDPDQQSSAAAAELREWEFDAAPVREWPIRRYAARQRLEGSTGTVGDVAVPIDASLLVSSSTPLSESIERLLEQPYLFVLGPTGVSGILTLADLQLAPVSMVVLGLILAGESALNVLIAERHSDEGWLELLPDEARERIDAVYEVRKKANAQISKLECATYEHRLRITARTPDLYEALGFGSRNAFEAATEPLKRLRDVLAHGGGVLDSDPDPPVALQRFMQVRDFAEQAWAQVSASQLHAADVPVVPTALAVTSDRSTS